MKKVFTKIVFAAASLAAVMGLASCSKSNNKSSSDEKVLYLYNWTYYTPDDVIADFEKEFGCTVKVDSYASNEEMFTKIIGGAKGYDIVIPSQDYVSIMIEEGMLSELDQSKLENAHKYVNPEVLKKATYDPEMKYAVPYYFGAAGISVNKDKVSGVYERTWNIFADKQFENHATMMDDMREVMGDALAYQGNSVNSLNDKELKSASDLIINSWKPNLVKFDAEGFGKSFAQGDFWLCQGYAEVIYGEVPEDKWDSIDFFIPEEGGPSYLDSMCILKDAPHYELANEFINYIQRPEVYARFLDYFRFPCFVNTEAQNYTTKKPMYEASMMQNCELKNDIGDGLDKYAELWEHIRF